MIFPRLFSLIFRFILGVIALGFCAPTTFSTMKNPLVVAQERVSDRHASGTGWTAAASPADLLPEAAQEVVQETVAELESELAPNECDGGKNESPTFEGISFDEFLTPMAAYAAIDAFHFDTFPDLRYSTLISHITTPELDPPRFG